MRNIRKFLMLGFLAAGLMVLPALLPGADAQAASNKSSSDSSTSKGANFERGEQAFSDGDWQGAIDYMKKAVADDAKNADAYNLMGYSYRRMGKADPAFEAYTMALNIDPKHRGANEYLGATYLLVGDVEKAKAQLAVLKEEACEIVQGFYLYKPKGSNQLTDMLSSRPSNALAE